MSENVNTRSYRSPLRDEQARATRRRVLEAAVACFLDHGYPRTTIAAVAVKADVSPDTVYHLFGSKRELLKQALDVIVGGDDEDVAVLERADPQAMRRESDQHVQLRMFAAGIAAQMDRVGPLHAVLRSAAAVDDDLAELLADIQLRQRRSAMNTIAEWLASNGPLRGDPDDAGAVIWALTSPEMYHLLCTDCGWDLQRYERWLRDTLDRTLIE